MMNSKVRQLKVKLKSLAAEQQIIKHEERKAGAAERWNTKHRTDMPNSEGRNTLRYHRLFQVRPEIRSTHIAYGLIRGMTLEQVETPRSTKSLDRKPYRAPDWKRIEAIVKKYGPADVLIAVQKLAA